MKAHIAMTRRQAMLVGAYCIAGGPARADSTASRMVEEINVEGTRVNLTKFIAPGSGRRPIVLLLHGSRGLDGRIEAYERYAQDLADAHIDAWLFSYFGPEDRSAIKAAGSEAGREAQYARMIDRWVTLVRAVAGVARDHTQSSGRVGLHGFSLGGFVAVATASQPLFSVLTVHYAGLPTFYRHEINFLPPLLDIHGDRDRSVSLKEGSNLVATAKRLGGVAELVVFPGEGHGFDLDPANRDGALARQRAIAFTTHWFNQN